MTNKFNDGTMTDLLGRPVVSYSQLNDSSWITVHPNGQGTKGVPVRISENGTIEAGMGGKHNGKKLSELGKKNLTGSSSGTNIESEGNNKPTGVPKMKTHIPKLLSTSVTISGGSEKQNAFASDIAKKWITTLNSEIKNISERLQYDPSVEWYGKSLEKHAKMMMEGLQKIKAKDLIDLYTVRKYDMPRVMIERAQKDKPE